MQEELKAEEEVAVVATDVKSGLITLVLLISAGHAGAKVLPEDRADVLYHGYDGGGVTIQGPSTGQKSLQGQDFYLG